MDQSARIAELLRTVPEKSWDNGVPTWPVGMPSALWPDLIIVGISPGASPANSKDEAEWSPGPNLGNEAFEHFYYRDGRKYWEKVRSLAHAFFRRHEPDIEEKIALQRTTHLNAGTGKAGRGDENAIEAEYVAWIARLLDGVFQPKAIIFLGYVGLSRSEKFRSAWASSGGMKIEWSRPDQMVQLPGSSYSFRIWKSKNMGGQQVDLIIWPNHPSQKIPGHTWASTLDAFDQINF